MSHNRTRPYRYLEYTQSLCSHCAALIAAKIVVKDDAVFLLKYCPAHGEHFELLEDDVEYYLNRRRYDKPGTASKTQTTLSRGCPHDCGLCPAHDQHTCIGLIEVTPQCDLRCPVCFAQSAEGAPLELPVIERMLDAFQESEDGEAEILQLSGGEPTTHPRILDIIRLAKKKKIRFIMLNTNGLRLAEDRGFVAELSQCTPGFEVYLQFDGFEKSTYEQLRGRDLSDIKQRALAQLAEFEIPVTLVTTVQAGVNEHELGHIVQFAMDAPYVRGVNFQPMAFVGRYPSAASASRITLTGVLRRLEAQMHGMLRVSDFIPLPCDVDRVAVTYLYRAEEGFIPITRNTHFEQYLPLIDNTLAFDAGRVVKQLGQELLSGQNICKCLSFMKDLLPLAPVGKNMAYKGGKWTYAIEKTFRITVTSFIDQYNCDLKSLQKECVHVLLPDGRKMPFSAYNMLHRAREHAHV